MMKFDVLLSCPTCGALWVLGPLEISHAEQWVPPMCAHIGTMQYSEPAAVLRVEHVEMERRVLRGEWHVA